MKKTLEELEFHFQEYRVRDNFNSVRVDDIDQQTTALLSYDRIELNYLDFERSKKELLETLYTFFNECIQFQSYIEINSEGVRKILKKYKK